MGLNGVKESLGKGVFRGMKEKGGVVKRSLQKEEKHLSLGKVERMIAYGAFMSRRTETRRGDE